MEHYTVILFRKDKCDCQQWFVTIMLDMQDAYAIELKLFSERQNFQCEASRNIQNMRADTLPL